MTMQNTEVTVCVGLQSCRTGDSECAACTGDGKLGVVKDAAVKHLCHTNSTDMLELQQLEDL